MRDIVQLLWYASISTMDNTIIVGVGMGLSLAEAFFICFLAEFLLKPLAACAILVLLQKIMKWVLSINLCKNFLKPCIAFSEKLQSQTTSYIGMPCLQALIITVSIISYPFFIYLPIILLMNQNRRFSFATIYESIAIPSILAVINNLVFHKNLSCTGSIKIIAVVVMIAVSLFLIKRHEMQQAKVG